MGDELFYNVCSFGLMEESEIGEVLLGMGFIGGFWGFGKMKFECSPCLVRGILLISLSDITCKYVGIANVDEANVNELGWCGGRSLCFCRGGLVIDGLKYDRKRIFMSV